MAVRFVGHVFPGETLVVSAWKEKNTIVFETKTKERKTSVLVGYLNFAEEPKAKL
jgi:acyl dehydratase